MPPKKEVISDLYKKFMENLEILPEISNEEGLHRFWMRSSNYYVLKTWLEQRIKRSSEATVHDPMFRKIMSQTKGETPRIGLVNDLYNECVENLGLLTVPNEEILLKIWQKFGDYGQIKSWYDRRVRFCKELSMTDPAIIAGAWKAINTCKKTLRPEDTTNTLKTVKDLFKEFVLDFKKSVPTVSAFFSKHSYYKIEDAAEKNLRGKVQA